MDERIMMILKTVARGDLSDRDDGYTFFCPHCSFEDSIIVQEPVEHDADCIVTMARAVLRDLGKPMRLYLMEWELSGERASDGTIPIGYMRFSPQRQRYLYRQHHEDIDTEDIMKTDIGRPRSEWGGIETRNLTITLIREFDD